MADNDVEGVSVVLPVYNEARAITTHLASLRDRFAELFGDRPSEMLLADNASTDATADLVSQMRIALPEVQYLYVEQRGRGPAMAAAFRAARFPLVAVMAIDRAWDERFLTDAIGALEAERVTIVYGPKTHPQSRVSRRAHRTLGSIAARALMTVLFGRRRHDTQCIKLFRAHDIPFLAALGSYNYFAEAEFALRAERAGIRSAQVPVTVEDRRRDSKVRAGSLFEFMREALHFRRTGWRA